MEKSGFNVRAFISFLILFAFLVMSITGIVLYLSPPGRDANWINWEMAGLLRTQWAAIHTVFSWLFIISGAIHLLVYNLKPVLNYLRDTATRSFKMTAELAGATALTLVMAAGVYFFIPPFSSIVELGTKTADSWVKKSEKPPVAHAELMPVNELAVLVKVDPAKAVASLEAAGIKGFDGNTLLGKIAKENKKTPREIYLLMIKGQSADEGQKGSMGLGEKTFTYVCKEEGLDAAEALKRLKAKGIKAVPSQTMKAIYLENGINPHEILKIMKEN